MMKKNLLLLALTTSMVMPGKTLRAELSGGEIATLAIAGAATICGLYAVGKKCDIWGNPNPHELFACSEMLLAQAIKYSRILETYTTCPSEDLLYTLAVDNIHLSVHAYQLEQKSEEIRACLDYMQRSRHYYSDTILQDQLKLAQSSLTRWARDLRSFEEYLCKHAPYFALFAQEKHCLNTYAQEKALYESYAYNPEYLRNQIYQTAQCKYHNTYAIISYIEQLGRDITALENSMKKAITYNRAACAQRIYVIMFYLYELVVNDPSYIRLVNDYHRYKMEQERLRIERERLEFERIQAAAERARLARERERAEYARIQAQREREMYYHHQYEHDHYKFKLEQERTQRERAQAEARQKADADRRNERERQERAQRRDAERSQREAEDAARIAKQREAEKKDPYRDYEEQERERKKRKREEKATDEARKQQELKDEQYRYTVFDRFV